jgi:GT2 family glycosyltransferase
MAATQRPTAAARIAVVIVTYHSAEVLGDCLASLHGQGVTLTDVLVVDNASADKSLAIAADAEHLPVRTIAMGRNAGYAAAINAGIAALDLSTVDAVLVLNPDCRLTPACLAALAGALQRPEVGIAVPLLRNPDGSLQPSIRNAASVRRALAEAVLGRFATRLGGPAGLGELVTDPRPHAQPGPVCWATGAAMLLARRTIERLGAWDESFLLYSEETEYCLRAADIGLVTWHEATAVVEHIGGDQHTSPMLAKLAVVNRVRLFRRRHNVLHGAAYFAAVAVGEGIRGLLGRTVSRASFTALVRPSRRVHELPGPEQTRRT